MLKEMKVAGITVDPFTNTPIVLLKDLDDKDVLPIWIGLLEASSIATALENIATPRPMTHDLLKNILDNLHVKVLKIEVNDLKDNTYYAVLHLEVNKKRFTVDCPSQRRHRHCYQNRGLYIRGGKRHPAVCKS